VPHDGRLRTACRGAFGKTIYGIMALRRKRAARVNLRPDGVAMVDQEQVHDGILVSGLGARVRGSEETMRVRGWLFVLCALLLVWQPLNLGMTMAGLVDELSRRGPGLAVILLARLLAAGLGIAAGLSLFQLKPGAVTIAKASLTFSAIVDLIVYATPYSPSNRPPGDATIILVASLVYYGLWFVYLSRSKRVKATYN
jgi:hypothetical protein